MTQYNVLVQSHLFDAVAEKATDGASHRSFSLYTICALLLTSIGYAGAGAAAVQQINTVNTLPAQYSYIADHVLTIRYW